MAQVGTREVSLEFVASSEPFKTGFAEAIKGVAAAFDRYPPKEDWLYEMGRLAGAKLKSEGVRTVGAFYRKGAYVERNLGILDRALREAMPPYVRRDP